MRYTKALWLSGAVLAAALSATLSAEDKAADKPLVGIVKPAAEGAVEAATFTVGKVVYRISKDENGRTVAKEAKNQKVEMKGVIAEKDGIKWIKVTSCKIVE